LLDPQYQIIKAVLTALNGLALPVHTTIPLKDTKGNPIDEYVLISQPTLNLGSGSAACLTWDATLMLSVYTKFPRSAVSVIPALTVSGEIMNQLLGQRLDLGTFSMSPLELQRLSLPQRYDDLNVYVQDNLRLRFEVYAEPSVTEPVGKQLNEYTPAEIRAGYGLLSELQALICQVPDTSTELTFIFLPNSQDSYSVVLGSGKNPSYITGYEVADGSAEVRVNGTLVMPGTTVGSAGQVLEVTRTMGSPTVTLTDKSAATV